MPPTVNRNCPQTPSVCKVSEYQLISQPRLDKFQLQIAMLQQMFEVTATRFHAATHVCATDQQRRRSLSLKPRLRESVVADSSATTQCTLGAHRLK